METTQGPIRAGSAAIQQFAAENPVNWGCLSWPSDLPETTIWIQTVIFLKQPFFQSPSLRADIINCSRLKTYFSFSQNITRKSLRQSWNMLGFQHRVILWCSAINYCYTTIINNFLNENDSVDLRCILIIRVKHNYTAALSWHVDSFRAQFCFNTLIM